MSTREDSPLQLETAEETQDEPIEEEEEVEEDPVEEEEPEQDDTPVQAAAKSKGKAKAQTALPYEPGKSLLPFSRVQKIIKVDKVSSLRCVSWIDLKRLTGHSYGGKRGYILDINRDGRVHQTTLAGSTSCGSKGETDNGTAERYR